MSQGRQRRRPGAMRCFLPDAVARGL